MSEVLWDMTIGVAEGWGGIFGLVGKAIIGVIWFVLTVFILCIMEVRKLGFGYLMDCACLAPYSFRFAGFVRVPARFASALGGG